MQNQDGIVSPENVTTIRHVDANRGVEWISAGFTLFMKKPGELIVAGVILFVISFVLNFIPLIGGGLATMIGVVAAGALMRACQAIEEGQDPIAAAQKAAGHTPLFILGLIAAGMGIVIALISTVLMAAVVGAFFISPFAAVGLAGISGLLMMLISIPLLMALWMAPALVIMKNVAPVEAVRLSFVASLKNFVPFIIFYVLAAVACLLGARLMGVGLIFVYPVLLCASYIAYKDIFATAASGEAVGFIQDAP
jgi:uncharacterized membrane protein